VDFTFQLHLSRGVAAHNENCTGLAQIARLGPTLLLKFPIRALKLAHNLGQPFRISLLNLWHA
jgi:hypothetical protein